MSYNIHCKDSQLRIRDEKAALTALKKKHGEPAATLEAFFEHQGWELERASDHIRLRYSNTMPEDLFGIFKTLAKFVEDGSYMLIEGEEHVSCRMDFKGGKLKTTNLPESKVEALPSTSIIAPKPASTGPTNSVSFETICRREYQLRDELLIRVHLGDETTLDAFFPDMIAQFKAYKLGCTMAVRLISVTLTGALTANEFADRWKSAMAAEPAFFFSLTPIIRAEVYKWFETGAYEGPVAILDQAAIRAYAAEAMRLLGGPSGSRGKRGKKGDK